MLAVLFQMQLYISHECMLLCSIFCSILDFDCLIFFHLEIPFFLNLFSASLWNFSRVSQAQSHLTLSLVSDSWGFN